MFSPLILKRIYYDLSNKKIQYVIITISLSNLTKYTAKKQGLKFV
jgi:hypothetical protein